MTDRTELSTDVHEIDVSFMEEYVEEDNSLDSLKGFFIPSVIKKLEANSNPKEVVDEHGAGCMILTPQNECIWKKGDEPLQFVPIIFTPIYRKWLHFDDPEGPKTVEQSFDPMSGLAKTALSADLRSSEEYGDRGFKYQCVEHLMFTGVLYAGPHAGTQCTVSFERSGNFKGKAFSSAIRSRKITINGVMKPQPMWSQVWGLTLVEKSNTKGRWHALNFCVGKPSTIDEQYAEPFHNLYKEWTEMQREERIKFSDETTANDMAPEVIDDDGQM